MSPAAVTIRRWKDDILAFVRENFHLDPDPWQKDGLLAFADPSKPRVALQACVGPGKSTVMSWCAWWFLSTQGEVGNHPKGVATSVTGSNLDDGLWAELAKWRGYSPFLQAAFAWTKTRIFAKDHPETWFIAARSWPKSASPEQQGDTLAGLHSKFIAAFVDESATIPTAVARKADQILSSCAFGCIMQSGNPSFLDGMLHEAANLRRDQWHVIRITGDPDDPKAWVHAERLKSLHKETDDDSCLCPSCWARKQIATYGRDNPWVMSSILGQFPPSSINSLLGIEDVEAAIGRHLREDEYNWAQKRLGVDVARYGDDRTVIFPRQGLATFRPVVMRHRRGSAVSVDIADRVMAAKAKWGSELELFDATGGWAAGAVDVLTTAGLSPINVQFSAPARDPRYANRRAEIWFGMAEWVKSGGALPHVPELLPELTTPTYSFKGGKFLLEDKDQVKKRLGRSPDLADALALTFGMVDMPAAAMALARPATQARTEFDPYQEQA